MAKCSQISMKLSIAFITLYPLNEFSHWNNRHIKTKLEIHIHILTMVACTASSAKREWSIAVYVEAVCVWKRIETQSYKSHDVCKLWIHWMFDHSNEFILLETKAINTINSLHFVKLSPKQREIHKIYVI